MTSALAREDPATVAPDSRRDRLATAVPAEPIEWINYPPDERPYKNPEDEYKRSPYLLSPQQLKARWRGLCNPRLIDNLLETPYLAFERMRVQAVLAGEAITFDVSDPVFKANTNAVDIALIRSEITRVKNLLDGMKVKDFRLFRTKRTRRSKADEPAFGRFEFERDLRIREITLLQDQLAELMKMYRLLQGEATDIAEVRSNAEASHGKLTVEELLTNPDSRHKAIELAEAVAEHRAAMKAKHVTVAPAIERT